eukprot:15364337-Ditylum_brightwellii.AAC.2
MASCKLKKDSNATSLKDNDNVTMNATASMEESTSQFACITEAHKIGKMNSTKAIKFIRCNNNKVGIETQIQ